MPTSSKALGTGLAAAGFGPLAYALYSQYFLDARPCELCLYQRAPFLIAGLTGVLVWFGWTKTLLLRVASAAFAIGSAIAVYHVGVEQRWWASAVCDGGVQGAISTRDLLSGLNQAAEKPCGAIDWTFLGFSMATWNVLYSAAFAILLFTLVRRIERHDPAH